MQAGKDFSKCFWLAAGSLIWFSGSGFRLFHIFTWGDLLLLALVLLFLGNALILLGLLAEGYKAFSRRYGAAARRWLWRLSPRRLITQH